MFTPVRKTILAAIMLLILIIASSSCSQGRDVLAERLIEEINSKAEEFLAALEGDNFSRAYSLLAPELQGKIVDASSLEKVIEENQSQPSEWELTFSYILTPLTVEVIEARVEGLLTYRNGRKGAFEFELARVEGKWMIVKFIFSW